MSNPTARLGSAKAYSGGVWWDPSAGHYTAHYHCAGCKPCGLCMATSKDGLRWTRPAPLATGHNKSLDHAPPCIFYTLF
jgi:hypothetical protein